VIDRAGRDLVRRRWLDNDFYGATYSLNYTPSTVLNLSVGGAYNEYDGRHFGEVIKTLPLNSGLEYGHYYDGTGFKTDLNIFGKIFNQKNL